MYVSGSRKSAMIRIGVIDQLDIVLFLERQVAVVLEPVERALPGDGGFPDDDLLLVVRLQEVQYSPDRVGVSSCKLTSGDYKVRLDQNLPVADRSENVVLDFPNRLLTRPTFAGPAVLNNPFFLTQRLPGAAPVTAGPKVFPPNARPIAPNPKPLRISRRLR